MENKKNTLLLLLWALPLTICFSLIMALHNLPHKQEPLTGLNQEPFTTHHFLSLECQCSKNVLTHLLKRQAILNANEVIHLIHSTSAEIKELSDAHFQVTPSEEEQAVKNFHLQAVPQLVITHQGEKLYQGGYGPDQQHLPIYEDVKIITALLKNPHAKIPAFPIFGCANGQERKDSIDVLRIKQRTKNAK
jgi:hypothetical protein